MYTSNVGLLMLSKGNLWYAGDHCAFVFAGTPCAVTAENDLLWGELADTHTPRYTPDCVATELIDSAAEYIAALIRSFD